MSFYLSKIIWLVLNPFNLFIFINITAIFFYILTYKKFSIFIFITNFLFLFIISSFPIGSFLIYKLEKQYYNLPQTHKKIDGILILGGATNPMLFKEHNQVSLNGSSERLFEAISIIKTNNIAKVIFSGGSGIPDRPDLEHAQVAKLLFEKMGLETNKIVFEKKSRNTYENILFSKKIIKPQQTEKWLLITSASHMKRATLIASKLDWEIIPHPVDFQSFKNLRYKPNLNFLSNLNSFQKASHEWLGLIYYYYMNRTERIF
mgnify:CR=1 FL=1